MEVLVSSADLALKRSHNPCAQDMLVVAPSNGCIFGCLFCPVRSYGQEPDKISLYSNLPVILERELKVRCRQGNVPVKVMFDLRSDLFQPIGALLDLALDTLRCILEAGCEVYLVTRSIVPERFEKLFHRFREKIHIQVSFFSMDVHLVELFEQRVPSAQERLESIRRMVKWGMDVRGRLGPFIPFISDTVGHIEDLFSYLRSVGVRRFSAGYLVLRPHMLESFQQALPTAQYQLIKGNFQGQAWQEEGIRQMTKPLPARIRRPGYERIANIARRIGIEVGLCACLNPGKIVALESRSCFDPVFRQKEHSRPRGQLELFQP